MTHCGYFGGDDHLGDPDELLYGEVERDPVGWFCTECGSMIGF